MHRIQVTTEPVSKVDLMIELHDTSSVQNIHMQGTFMLFFLKSQDKLHL